jgi:two-component system sensor histidine kinase VicK
MRPELPDDALLQLLDRTVDGILVTAPAGDVRLANAPCRRLAESLGLSLDGVFVDRMLELADRTSEPYALTAALERLGDEWVTFEFEDAATGRSFGLHASALDPGIGRVWTLREVTAERERERERDELVATLGHELRTPLTSMTGFLELVRAGSAGPLTAEQERYLEIVHRAAERLHELVDELIDEPHRTATETTKEAG